MIVKFTNPCPNGISEGTSFLNKSKLKFKTQTGDFILCPYDGKVTKVDRNSVEITHKIEGKKWVSILEGFNPNVTPNQLLREGKQIGYTINGKFTFDISPNVNIEDLISIGVNSSNYKSNDNNLHNGRENDKSTDDPLKGVLKVFLSPLTFVQGALNLDEQEINEKTTLIKEDIDRIKKLF
jgi:hypothetical protein